MSDAERSRPRRAGGRAGLAALGLCLAGLWVAAASQERTREQELQGIRAEIARLQARLAEVRRSAEGLAGELARLDLELALQEQRLAEAVAARDLAGERVADAEAEVARLGEALTAARDILRRRLLGLYRLGRHGSMRVLLSIDPERARRGSDLLAAIRILRYLARRDAEAIERYVGARTRLAAERSRLLVEAQEMALWSEQEEARRAELVTLRGRRSAVLARVEAEGQRLAERTDLLLDKEQRLASFLDALYGRSPTPLAGTPIQSFRGVLDWPVAGDVRVGFGPRRDPRYQTTVPHNGIDLATSPGVEVRAVFPGQVLFASPFEGYGPTVVVLHPGRVFSLYAGLAEIKVEREDVVSLNQIVGLASDRLYFEVRVENRPDDPLRWLR